VKGEMFKRIILGVAPRGGSRKNWGGVHRLGSREHI